MNYDEFVGQVQHRARLGSTGEAVRAIHATLSAFGQRLFDGGAENLAAQLPREIGNYLLESGFSESFGLDEFFRRVSYLEQEDLPDSVHHARAVISVMQEAVTPGEMDHVRAQLPDEWNALFEAGSEGEMHMPDDGGDPDEDDDSDDDEDPDDDDYPDDDDDSDGDDDFDD